MFQVEPDDPSAVADPIVKDLARQRFRTLRAAMEEVEAVHGRTKRLSSFQVRDLVTGEIHHCKFPEPRPGALEKAVVLVVSFILVALIEAWLAQSIDFPATIESAFLIAFVFTFWGWPNLKRRLRKKR